jgi:hypothetical protein
MAKKISSRLNKIQAQIKLLENERKELELKRAHEIGALAIQCGIDILDNNVLLKAFNEISHANPR